MYGSLRHFISNKRTILMLAGGALLVGAAMAEQALPVANAKDSLPGSRLDVARDIWLEDVDGDGHADIEAGATRHQTPGHIFDTDRQVWLQDSDGDGTTDLAEELGHTDAYDPRDYPGSDSELSTSSAGFPTTSCRSGFRAAGSRLCISTDEQNALIYYRASEACREQRAHVCTAEDLFYLYLNSTLDASYNPHSMWLGHFIHEDAVLMGDRDITVNNDSDMFSFEGFDNKANSRSYWCCHDRE